MAGGGIAALCMWPIVALGTRNLSSGDRSTLLFLLMALAGVLGMLAGGLIARRDAAHPILFGVTTGAVVGAISGSFYALCIGIAYEASYGGWPVNGLDWISVVVAYPVFVTLGALVGAIPGSMLGFVGGLLSARVLMKAEL